MTDPTIMEQTTNANERLCDCGNELEDWEEVCDECYFKIARWHDKNDPKH